MDYAPGFEQYQQPEKFTDKLYRAITLFLPKVLVFLVGIGYWLIKLIRDFIRDAYHSVFG